MKKQLQNNGKTARLACLGKRASSLFSSISNIFDQPKKVTSPMLPRQTTLLASAFIFSLCPAMAQVAPAGKPPKVDTAEILSKHLKGAEGVADKQDQLAADVQQLKIEQTNGEVIKLLDEVEFMMDDATEMLLDAETGGETIAAQTEVIEKIFEAAKKKQGGEGQGAQGMMEMMKRMMGEGAEGDEKKPGNKPGDKPGDGQKGESDTANTANNGASSGEKAEERRVPKASGLTDQSFPEEYRKALDAYNRALTK